MQDVRFERCCRTSDAGRSLREVLQLGSDWRLARWGLDSGTRFFETGGSSAARMGLSRNPELERVERDPTRDRARGDSPWQTRATPQSHDRKSRRFNPVSGLLRDSDRDSGPQVVSGRRLDASGLPHASHIPYDSRRLPRATRGADVFPRLSAALSRAPANRANYISDLALRLRHGYRDLLDGEPLPPLRMSQGEIEIQARSGNR